MPGEKFPLIEYVVSPSLTVKIQVLAASVRWQGEVVLAEDIADNEELKAALYAKGSNSYVKILFSEDAEDVATALSEASTGQDDAVAYDGLVHQVVAKKEELETALAKKLDAQNALDAGPENEVLIDALASETTKVSTIEAALAALEAQLITE